MFDFLPDPTHNYTEPLLSLVTLARTRLAGLPREQAAATARVLLNAEFQFDARGSRNRAPRLQAFIDEYAGTDTALLTGVDLIQAAPINLARLDALEAFAGQHPHTTAAAKAIYQKGYDLAQNASALRLERPGDDPTPRFTQVVEISRRLQNGDFPACEWVGKAPELVIQFGTYRPTLSPEHVAAMLSVYRDLLRRELPSQKAGVAGSSLDYLINSKMGDLFELGGDRIVGIESVYSELERIAPNPAEVRYARALSYLRYLVEPTPDRAAVVAKAISALRAVHAENVQPFARRALATLASVHFFQRDYAAARAVYQEYVARYPSSDWTWVARIRLGESETALDDLRGAAGAYAAAASARDALPAERVVALALSADALAELGQVKEALRDAERALAEWDDDFGQSYRTQASQAVQPGGTPFAIEDDTTIAKISLQVRVLQLRASATAAGGASLEQARRLIARRHEAEAVPILRRATAEARGTTLESVARSALHHAQLLEALAKADVARPNADIAAAQRALEALGAEPLDFHVFAARIARATLLSSQPAAATQADTIMMNALDEWRARQPTSGPPTAGSLEADVAAMRAEVFRPQGGGVYGATKWNAFEWPAQLPRFLIANPDLTVKLASGETRQVSLRQPIAGHDAIIFMNNEEMEVFNAMITALGSKGRREPTSPMQTPNQPAAALDVGPFWNRYFPMRPGHWSGWVFETYPAIGGDVTFLDEARTKAAVHVTVGYSGGTVMLVKEAGVWRAKELVGLWIT